MADLPPDNDMHTPDGLMRALAWARGQTDDELLAMLALGKDAYPPSKWVLITAELNRRGLWSLFQASPDPAAEASLTATLNTLTATQEEKAKESDGALAFWVFLGTAIVTLLGRGKLLSLGAVIYLLVGGFLSAIVFGLVAFGLRKLVLSTLVQGGRDVADSTVSGIGVGLLILDVLVALIATRWLTLTLFS